MFFKTDKSLDDPAAQNCPVLKTEFSAEFCKRACVFIACLSYIRGCMRGRGLAAQLALEFLVVYSFVLLIFIIMFSLVTSQRAASLAQQQYALLQLQAQNVANLINEAVNAGNGFS